MVRSSRGLRQSRVEGFEVWRFYNYDPPAILALRQHFSTQKVVNNPQTRASEPEKWRLLPFLRLFNPIMADFYAKIRTFTADLRPNRLFPRHMLYLHVQSPPRTKEPTCKKSVGA